MIRDNRTTFGVDQDVAQASGTFNFSNQIDLGAAGLDVGQGQPLYVVVVVTGGDDGVITGGSSGDIQFQVVSDDSASIATSGQSVHLISPLYVTDGNDANELDQGDIAWCVALPTEGHRPYERFLGLQFIVGTTTITEGTVTAFLSLDPVGWKSYPDATN